MGNTDNFSGKGVGAGRIGRAVKVTGQVIATGADQCQRVLQTGDPLYADDRIDVVGLSTLMIDFVDGTGLTLGRNARAVLDEEVFNPTFTGETQRLIVDVDVVRHAIAAHTQSRRLARSNREDFAKQAANDVTPRKRARSRRLRSGEVGDARVVAQVAPGVGLVPDAVVDVPAGNDGPVETIDDV